MKLLLSTALVSFVMISATAQAQSTVDTPINPPPAFTPGAIVSDHVVTVPIEINSKLVKFSRADYSMPTVKILIPAMADVTLLDHRNTREGAPCLAAYLANSPDDVIQNRDGKETADLHIVLRRLAELKTRETEDVKGAKTVRQVCQILLVEQIETQIRGQRFQHERMAQLPDRNTADCK